MIRDLISLFRTLLVGPQLSRLSKLQTGEVEQLVTMSRGALPVSGVVSSGVDPETSAHVAELRGEVARLGERIEVLERLLAARK